MQIGDFLWFAGKMFAVQVAEYLSGRNLNMVFSTFILRYVESKFTLLTYLMENNTVITVISYCTKGLNNSKQNKSLSLPYTTSPLKAEFLV